jgi:diguanylate cyclase (GGDEF)-like protein
MNNNILLVDDDPGVIQLMGHILSGAGQLRFATNGKDALRLARESTPDLILLDAEMPGMNGFEVCKTLKGESALSDVPVIFVSSHSETAFELAGFKTGAVDFILKPVNAPLILARVTTQLNAKRMADELRSLSNTDSLTSVANRRKFDETLEREWLSGRRTGSPMALLLIDIDHFKLFNDNYGHPAGDTCLRNVAQALASVSLRPADLVARYGGEEFAVLLPQTPRRGAEQMARGILDAVEALGIPHATSSTDAQVTVSIGIAYYDDASACWTADFRFNGDLHAGCSADNLTQAADHALYSAKNAGRARARLLDIADVDNPQLARDIAPRFRAHSTTARNVRH